jgi:hypothetical protein
MQHLNNGFNKFKVNDSTHFSDVVSWRNGKKHTKPFKYNCKTLSCMCFNIL